jgi:hypothetical protein
MAAPPVIVLLPWFALRHAYGIEAAGFTPGAAFQPALFLVAARSLLMKAFAPHAFSLTFFLFVAAAAAAFFRRKTSALAVPLALVCWHILGALLAYSTGRNEIQWWLETSADRILAQIAPLALLPPALVFSSWQRESEPERRTVAHRSARPQKSKGAGRRRG